MARVRKITKREADRAAPGDYFLWDEELSGFGLRVFPSGRRSWLIQYFLDGRTRRYTLGGYPPITPTQARRKAAKLLAEVRVDGRDPSQERRDRLDAPTVADLAERYIEEHLPKNKPRTARENRRILEKHVLPALGRYAVDAVTESDVNRLHASLRKTPIMANRVLFLVSTLFGLAERWGMCPTGSNPARHVTRYREAPRERHLSEGELAKLGKALSEFEATAPHVVAAVRLLILTGCRKGEILGLRWEDVEFERGLLLLPDSKTGRRPVVLNGPAVEVLREIPRRGEWVFPNRRATGPLGEFRKTWRRILAKAELEPTLRLHDLRHTHASQGLLEGLSLPAIGALLGHSRAATTSRYAHWAEDPLRDASERVGARIESALQK